MNHNVFISYSHDSEEHQQGVLNLTDRLREEGIDCIIDQYEESPSEGWGRWAINQIEAAEFVLVVCTQQYSRLFSGKEETVEGKAANWQGAIITQSIYDSQSNHTKFIPIVLSAQDFTHIPVILRSATVYTIDTDYEQLYRRLTNQFATPMQELGVIRQLPRRDRLQFFLDEDRQSILKEELLSASKGLLDWKRTLGNNQQIKRPELAQLTDRIETETASTTIVLGSPGCGKSALMATLGHWAVNENHVLLAIHAYYLNNTVNTLEDLQKDIHLSWSIRDAISAIASTDKVILLIDQLDAVAEMLDRQPGRLNVLLSLIQSLADTKNVHIIATCREFEFRHGTQFARLESFERMDLHLPAWEDIVPFLEAAQHNTKTMGETLQELLRNPLHLRIFLEIAQPGDVFKSLPRLLDQLWKRRIVVDQPQAQESIAFLTKLADHMTDDEVLWVSSAIADENPEICGALEQAGILMTNPENSTLGFCHQTFYDHTLARAFARGAKSLTELVLDRQDGIFVRPILLRSLNYLRGTALPEYQRQLKTLLTNSDQPIRLHIRTLLLEFVGAQTEPNATEASLLIPLLNSETEGIKVLDAMIGSPGWFRKLRDRPEFTQWLGKTVEQALYCSPLLTTAASFAAEHVWNLLEEYWLDDKSYDFLSIRVIRNIDQWTPERVWLTERVIQRSSIDWHTVAEIEERISEALPDCSARVIRAHLEYRLTQALEASRVPPPELPADADEVGRSVHPYRYDPFKELKALLESESNFYEIEKFAEVSPKNFLASIWPWFVDLIQQNAYDAIPVTINHRWDRFGDFNFSRSEVIRSLLMAVMELAKRDRTSFLQFVEQNSASDLLVVHRLLACGLEIVATDEPTVVLDYLLADPRRFVLGRQMGGDHYRETEKLIAAIFPRLPPEDRARLEQTIRELTYWNPQDDKDANFRRRCLEHNREHRLSLLQAIPQEHLSLQAKRLKEEEERALPWFDQRKSNGVAIVQSVGPRMTKDEMSRASDQHLLNLFDELSDETEWHHPSRPWSDDRSRSGGSIQQAREFGKLAKGDPDRFLRLLPHFQPEKHEHYVGSALNNLAETDFPAETIIQTIEKLNQQGFVSKFFQTEAASALEKLAQRNKGLPQSVISLMEDWLETHPEPDLKHYESNEAQSCNFRSPILFGFRSFDPLPSGRGDIVRAISEGYLSQSPPDLIGWAGFIRSRMGVELHPALWVDIVARMAILLNSNRTEATELFDQVLRHCPEVLQHAWALYRISRTIGWFEPKETVEGWLDMLLVNDSNFSKQVYGELLFLQYFQYQDEWSVDRIRGQLVSLHDEAILCGLAHAASHLWVQQRCRSIASDILYTLASSSSTSVQHAVASVFRWSRDCFRLDQGMRQIIKAVCHNKSVLLEAANDLIEIIEVENLIDDDPTVVAEICRSLIDTARELMNPERATALIGTSLTTIAIQLHRQPEFREIGLQMFEDLLALNVRETQAALETLDRKPNRPNSYVAPRRRMRSRETSY